MIQLTKTEIKLVQRIYKLNLTRLREYKRESASHRKYIEKHRPKAHIKVFPGCYQRNQQVIDQASKSKHILVKKLSSSLKKRSISISWNDSGFISAFNDAKLLKKDRKLFYKHGNLYDHCIKHNIPTANLLIDIQFKILERQRHKLWNQIQAATLPINKVPYKTK